MENKALKTKAIFQQKKVDFEAEQCVIEKIIELDNKTFSEFSKYMVGDFDFIQENSAIGGKNENGAFRTFLVISKDGNDGILVDTQGYEYAKYTAFMPNARQFIDASAENLMEVKLYSPLRVSLYDPELVKGDESPLEIKGKKAVSYEKYISEAIEKSLLNEDSKRGLEEYLDFSEKVSRKIYSAFPTVEKHDGELYGVMTMKTFDNLTPEDMEILKAEWEGAYEYVWGKDFEDCGIQVPDGEIFVQFWQKDDFYIKTEAEFFGQEQELNPEELQTLKFYSPLEITILDNEFYYDDVKRNISGADAVEYKDVILDAIKEYALPEEKERGIMAHLYNDTKLNDKVYSAFPTIEEHDGELYGVMITKIKSDLSPEDIKMLKNEWRGQYSDGWGEGFEQQDIKVADGEINVSFHGSKGFYIHTESEFFAYGQDETKAISMGM